MPRSRARSQGPRKPKAPPKPPQPLSAHFLRTRETPEWKAAEAAWAAHLAEEGTKKRGGRPRKHRIKKQSANKALQT